MLPVKKHAPSRAGMLLNYSALHLLTDGVCASVMLGSVLMHADAEKIAGLFLLYNLIAFCGQALTGALCDRLGSLHAAVRLSALLTACGFLFPATLSVTAKVILCGAGNALFHTSAGTAVIRRYGDRAYPLGLFVAPGALGIAVGYYMPVAGYILIPLMLLFAAAPDLGNGLLTVKCSEKSISENLYAAAAPVTLAVLAAVASRSFVGSLAPSYPVHGVKTALIAAFAVCAGKMLGGILYDKAGIIVCAAAIPAAAALSMLLKGPFAALAAALLINLTMPVTLVQLCRLMPNSPGFAFGVAAAMLYPGILLAGTVTPDISSAALAAGFALFFFFIVSAEIFLRTARRTKKDKQIGGGKTEPENAD